MSLEKALQELIPAINALVALLTTRTGPTMSASDYIASLDATVAAPQVDITAAHVEVAKVESPKYSPTAIAEPAPAAVTSTVASPSEPAAALDYSKDVKPLLLDLSKSKGRDALAELLAKFDATNGTQIAATAYADVIARVQSLLAA